VTNLLEFTTAVRTDADRDRAASLFQGAAYGEPSTLTESGWKNFEAALQSGNEEEIHHQLFLNPYLIQYLVAQSGHHGTWVFSKKTIKTQRADGTPGLIPDFLVATRNSLGYTWHVVELKKPTAQFSNASGNGYSTIGHKGIAQCANYIAHFNDYIETVRSNVGVQELITPKTAILVIGNSNIETAEQTACRRNFCALTDRIDVVTYNRIVEKVKFDRPNWCT
jgi:hypothetical protein